jgi:hypothetical protein
VDKRNDVFKQINNGLSNSVIQKLFYFTNKLYAGSQQQIFNSSNYGNSWQLKGHITYTVTNFFNFNDTLYISGINNFNGYYGSLYYYSDSLDSLIDSYNFYRGTYSIAQQNDRLYTSTFSGILQSSDSTNLYKTWRPFNKGLDSIRPIQCIVGNEKNYLFAFDNNNTLYRCGPDTTIWTKISLQINGLPVSVDLYTLLFINDSIYVGTNKGIFISSDYGNVWKQASEVGSILISTIINFEGGIYAGSPSGKLFRSSDKGISWTDITYDLPKNLFLKDIAADHEYLYAATSGASVFRLPIAKFYPSSINTGTLQHVTASSIALSGTASANGYATALLLEYSIDSNFSIGNKTTTISDTLLTDNKAISASLSGLSENTIYYYRWKGTNSAGVVSFSATGTFTTKAFLKIDAIRSTAMIQKSAVADTTAGNIITIRTSPLTGIVLNQFLPDAIVKLSYRNFVSHVWKDSLLESNSNTFRVQLPVSAFDGIGLEYYFSIIPPPGFSSGRLEDTVSATTSVSIYYPAGLPLPFSLHTGATAKDYNLFSFPLDLTDPRPGPMLYKILDTDKPDDTKYRFLTYVGPLGNANYKDIWNINPVSIIPGTAYWFAARRLSGILHTGSGYTVARYPNFDGTFFNLALKPGYNQVGNPYLLNVNWNDVQAASDSGIGPLIGWVRQGDSLSLRAISVLEPFSGGYVHNSNLTESILKIPVRNVSGTLRLGQSEESFPLAVNFTLENGATRMELAGLGIHNEAQQGDDTYDLTAPPMAADFPSFIFKEGTSLVRSIQPSLETGQQWDFEVGGLRDPNSTLQWTVKNIESDKQLWLYDLSRASLTDMLASNKYTFNNSANFRVYYGPEAYIIHHAIPEKYLLQIVPNPVREKANIAFTLPETEETNNFHVKISLLDVNGEILEVIEDKDFEAGFHRSVLYNKSNYDGLRIVQLNINEGNSKSRSYYSKVVFE